MRRQYCPICGMPVQIVTGNRALICKCGWNSEEYRKQIFEIVNKKNVVSYVR